MTELVAQYQPINLGQGCPDFAAAPKHILKALAKVAIGDQPMLNQYTRGFGHPRLVHSLSALYSSLLGREIHYEKELVVTYGASHALYCAIMAFVNPGDEVIIIEPFFDSYLPLVKLAGGVPVYIPLRPQLKCLRSKSSSDWILDSEELARCFTAKTAMIIVNTPNNPVGKVFSRSELEYIGKLVEEHKAIILMDEVYEFITYSDETHVRMATLPNMWDRTITVSSAGKVFSVTGWKLGWAYGPENLIYPLQLMHQTSARACPTPLQEAVSIGLELEIPLLGTGESYWYTLCRLLESKRDRLSSFLTSVGMDPVLPQGSYFVLADFSTLASKVKIEESGKTKDHKFVKWLTKTQGLQGIPLSAFYSEEHKFLAENYIRFCFIKDDATLEKAEKILVQLKSSLNETIQTGN